MEVNSVHVNLLAHSQQIPVHPVSFTHLQPRAVVPFRLPAAVWSIVPLHLLRHDVKGSHCPILSAWKIGLFPTLPNRVTASHSIPIGCGKGVREETGCISPHPIHQDGISLENNPMNVSFTAKTQQVPGNGISLACIQERQISKEESIDGFNAKENREKSARTYQDTRPLEERINDTLQSKKSVKLYFCWEACQEEIGCWFSVQLKEEYEKYRG
ncbi:hypothetical protein E2320_012824, partial [Naja naja]